MDAFVDEAHVQKTPLPSGRTLSESKSTRTAPANPCELHLERAMDMGAEILLRTQATKCIVEKFEQIYANKYSP